MNKVTSETMTPLFELFVLCKSLETLDNPAQYFTTEELEKLTTIDFGNSAEEFVVEKIVNRIKHLIRLC